MFTRGLARRQIRSGQIAAVIAAVLLLLPASAALADGPFEPNETLDAAQGPLLGGTDVTAGRETPDDRDWFFFYSSGPRQLDIQFKVFECAQPSHSIHFNVHDSVGKTLHSVRDYTDGAASHILLTTPGRRKFYISMTKDTPICKYTIRIDPADAITTESPGHVLSLAGDDVVRGSVDGLPVAEVRAHATDSAAMFDLGKLVEPQRLTLEVQQVGEDSDWLFRLTNDDIAVFSESTGTSGGKAGEIVRRVVLTPSGQIVDQCSTLGPAFCVIRDADGDGRPDASDTCPRLAAATPNGCPDGDQDGVLDRDDSCPALTGTKELKGCPARVSPRKMTLSAKPARDARAPFRFKFLGSVRPPANLPNAAACGGKVLLVLTRGKVRVAGGTAFVRKDCTYRRTISIADRRKIGRAASVLRVKATYAGNLVLNSTERALTVRIR